MSDWWPFRPSTQSPPAPVVYEKESPESPVLYDDKGKPLIRPRRKVGFEPPKKGA